MIKYSRLLLLAVFAFSLTLTGGKPVNAGSSVNVPLDHPIYSQL